MQEKKFLASFNTAKAIPPIPPIWLMRQAGRYLPEYRQTRQKAGSFLELCYDPDLAAQVTLQPIARYDFDAAILFADILLIPHALGQKLWFVDGEGPRLDPLKDPAALTPDKIHTTLAPIYQTLENLTQALPTPTALIGFAGAPWTVASYMIAGRGTPDQAPAHAFYKNNRPAFDALIEILIESTSTYLTRQIEAGAEVVQIFDSWAGSLSGDERARYCFEPNARIIQNIRQQHQNIPIIAFPRGIGQDILHFAKAVRPDGLSLDENIDINWACENLPQEIILQGNLHPQDLIAGGDQLNAAIDAILSATKNRRHIFNLGHGIQPQTSPDHVAQLVARIRGTKQ